MGEVVQDPPDPTVEEQRSDWVAGSIAKVTRGATAYRRRHSSLRHKVPPSVARRLMLLRSQATELRRFYIPVKHRSAYATVFHCCIQKTGSQWLMSLFSDPVVYRYCGLSHYHSERATPGPDFRTTAETRFDKPFPQRTIVSPLYVNYEAFRAIPKPDSSRAFYILRDPRDLIVSWYYSARDTHIVDNNPANPLFTARRALRQRSEKEGLRYAIDYWYEGGRFDALASWFRADAEDPNVRIFRYEDLVSEQSAEFFADLFEFADISVPPAQMKSLLEAYSFQRLSGRRSGDDDQRSHLRSGSAGSWRQLLDSELEAYLDERSGGLVGVLGYR